MPSVNDSLFDRSLSRAITLARLSSGETTELLRLFNKLERELIASLLQKDLTKYQQARFAALLTQVRETIRAHYRTIRDTHQEKMEDLVDLESTWTVRALNGALSAPVGVYVDVASISWTAQQLKAIASEAMIDSSPARSWWGKQATDLTRRFKDEVRTGLLKGLPTEEIVRRVREATELSRHQARGLVRTSISAVSASARRMTFEENADLIRAIQHRSTLDSRTSVICVAYSNKLFDMRSKAPIGHSLPYNGGLPRHWGERSAEVAVTKSFAELGGAPLRMADNNTLDRVFRQKLRDMNWDEERISKAMLNVQSSMDGAVSADIDVQTWLRGKSAAWQDEQLGKGKADLWRRGVVQDLSDLLSFDGNPLTLKQLRQQFGIAA